MIWQSCAVVCVLLFAGKHPVDTVKSAHIEALSAESGAAGLIMNLVCTGTTFRLVRSGVPVAGTQHLKLVKLQ
jgi:hypothetical protein